MIRNITYDINEKILTLSARHGLCALRYVVLLMTMVVGVDEMW